MTTRRSNRTRGRGFKRAPTISDSIYRQPLIRARSGKNEGAIRDPGLAQFYYFDGQTMDITIPGWVPRGFPWRVSMKSRFIEDKPTHVPVGGDLDQAYIVPFDATAAYGLTVYNKSLTDHPNFPRSSYIAYECAYRNEDAAQRFDGKFHGGYHKDSEVTFFIEADYNGHLRYGVTVGSEDFDVEKTDFMGSIKRQAVDTGANFAPGGLTGHFLGYLWEWLLDDGSPIRDTSAKTSSLGTIPPMNMTNGKVSFDYIHDGMDGFIIEGYLNVTLGNWATTPLARNLKVDGQFVSDGVAVVDGQHMRIEFETVGGELSRINSHGGMQNLILTTEAD